MFCIAFTFDFLLVQKSKALTDNGEGGGEGREERDGKVTGKGMGRGKSGEREGERDGWRRGQKRIGGGEREGDGRDGR